MVRGLCSMFNVRIRGHFRTSSFITRISENVHVLRSYNPILHALNLH